PRPEPAAAWRERALAWFEDVDVLLTPVIARPAAPAGSATRMGYWRAYLDGARRVPFTQAWNLAGFPALTLPMGAGAVQLIAAPGRESALLRAAADLERRAVLTV
ncbi:MAG: hypothetical protein JWO79_1087, partial [Actinomycetia bacterium]|nr:hypothetical protein [Actinomycetes bacterium]